MEWRWSWVGVEMELGVELELDNSEPQSQLLVNKLCHNKLSVQWQQTADVNWNQHIMPLKILVYWTVCCILPQ